MPEEMCEQNLHAAAMSFLGLIKKALGDLRLHVETYLIPDNWNEGAGLPSAERAGVYVFFDSSGEPVYVGKSERELGKRVCSHCGKLPTGEWWFDRSELQEAMAVGKPLTLAVIELPPPFICLAPALESFLIERLDPPGNRAA